jgi:tetratricopeptide (TPR) repeat protein
MLTFLVNALFKLKDYKNSLIYADILKKAMLEYDKLHYQKYEFFYNNTLVINYSVIDIDKAIDILKKMQESIDKKHMVFYDVFTYINLSLCFYKKNKYDDAIKQIIKVKTFDVYKNADEHLRLKIDIAEQIIRFEMTDFEIIDYRIQQIKREFKKLLTSQEALRENEMLKLLLLMSKTPNFAANKKLLKIAKETIAIETEIEEFIDYNEWILKKFRNLSA